jgi:metallo-beta-lactamase class B
MPKYDMVIFPKNTQSVVETTNPGFKLIPNPSPNIDYSPMRPVRLFDRCFYVGTKSVGSYVFETSDGLVMLDTGWNDNDCAGYVRDIKTLGLDPAAIKLIIISHEHIDHYGGTRFLKTQICPQAKVAMSLIGWNYLMTRPVEGGFDNPRPENIDIFLKDGDVIQQGNLAIKVVATPGHSPGCFSFIVPVTDFGVAHCIGLMGGTLVPDNWSEALLYYMSIEYFRGFTLQAGCDIGLSNHAAYLANKMEMLHNRRPGEANPLILGKENFETEYLQRYKDMFTERVKTIQPERLPQFPKGIFS